MDPLGIKNASQAKTCGNGIRMMTVPFPPNLWGNNILMVKG